MKFKCKICGTELLRGSGHIKSKHNLTTLEYIERYENIQICNLYEEGNSASQIASLVKEKNLGISPIKKDILNHLREKNIKIRATSEAIKHWSKQKGGPWNKGLTKEKHSSIASQAKKISGKNNTYFKLSRDKQSKTRYWEYKSEQEVENIRRKAANTYKKKIQDGEIIPYVIANPEWAKDLHDKRMEGYKQWLLSGDKVKFGSCSIMEKRIGSFLEQLGYTYIRQKSFGRYRFDYCLEEHKILIEYNGDYWHCNPEIYDPQYYNRKKDKIAEEIWKHDKKKLDKGKQKGYIVLVFWERHFKHLTDKQITEVIDETIKSKISKKT